MTADNKASVQFLDRQGGGKRRCVPRNLAASYFIERSAKLFDERASRCQIGKALSRICLIVPNNSATVSRLKASRFMKTYNLPV